MAVAKGHCHQGDSSYCRAREKNVGKEEEVSTGVTREGKKGKKLHDGDAHLMTLIKTMTKSAGYRVFTSSVYHINLCAF